MGEIAGGARRLGGRGGEFAEGVVELADGGGGRVIEDVEGWCHFWSWSGYGCTIRRRGGVGVGVRGLIGLDWSV